MAMNTDSSEILFLSALRTALNRKGQAPEFESLFPKKAVATASGDESSQLMQRPEQEHAIQSFLEEARALSMETACIQTPIQLADTIRAIANRTPAEWALVKTAVCCDHPLIRSTGIAEFLKGIAVDVAFPDAATSAQRFRNLCAEAAIGIFVADYAVAESATLVLRNSSNCPRLVSLLPSASIAILPGDCVLATFSQLADILAGAAASDGMSFITGPSKTADIEAVMVQGAHGPRSLHVLLTTF
jgi:L-lactate dehydrogenase complex protein LldG